ncbi:MAG: virulence factor [Hyphomonadaceae bacterium]|nr:MAG: virulence factor [Hyphomonadaceae bacterium]
MSLVRNTFVQASFTLLSRLFGYIRDRIISNYMGAGYIGDAFATAQMFPNLFRRILAEGAFSQAFVPIYAKATTERGKDGAEIMATEALSMLTLVSVIITIVAQIAMPWIMLLIHTGYKDDATAFNLAIILTQITMPYLVGMALSSLFAGILNTAGKFALSAAAPTLLNISILLAVIFTKTPEQAALNGAIAIAVAGVLQAAMLYWGCRNMGVKIAFRVPKITPDVKLILGVMGPAVIAGSATQINVFVSQALSSFEVGAKSWLYAADRLYQLPLGLIGVAIGVALLPRLAKAVANIDDKREDIDAINESFVLSMSLTLPAAAALLCIPFFLMYGFWAGGEFKTSDAQNTANALFHYAWGVPAFVLIRILAPPFFARQDTKSPMNFALVGVASNVIIGACLFYFFHKNYNSGYIGLAIGTSAAAWINTILLVATLINRKWWRFDKWVVGRIARVFLATIIMAGFLLFAGQNQDLIISWFSWAKILGKSISKELAILVVCGLGFTVYGVAALFTKALTISDLKALARP